MRKAQNILFVSIYTILFSALIFIGKEIFFPPSGHEEKYTEPVLGEYFSDLEDGDNFSSFSGSDIEDIDAKVQKLVYESFKQKYSQEQESKVSIRYIPTSLGGEIEYSYVPLAQVFLYKKDILSHINKLGVFLYKNRDITRGRMKSGNIHMYGIQEMSDSEFLGVLLHEFAHYYDIYSFPQGRLGDISQKFYDISWNSTTRMKEGIKSDDFVSGYAMTNQYEDFAETYVYYILHNKDFVLKAQDNVVLSKKYAFIKEYVFSKNQFFSEDFSDEKPKQYYWDITKLSVDVKKFLQYLQDDI